MKKIYGIILGVILASAIFFAFDKYMENEIQENKEEVRNHRTYERYWSREAQKLVMDENTLPIMGSSELMPLEDYNKNISNFLNGDDMNVMTIGAGNFQSLSHTMTLGAIYDGIKTKKVALFLSPQWFTTTGVSQEAFPARFSEDLLLGFLDNEKISDENKEYVLNRTLNLMSGSPTQYERVKKYKSSFENPLGVDGIYTTIMDQVWKIKSKYQVYKQIDNMSEEIPRIDLKSINYKKMLELAEKQGEKACTNNDFGIYDQYWDTYVKQIYEEGPVEETTQMYTESPEYDDLKCFLDVADELGIEVILVSIPVNEMWSEYRGELCDVYYENIRKIATEYECVNLLDMTGYGKEKYFFRDIMHLGWKGWTRINEALYKEFKEQ